MTNADWLPLVGGVLAALILLALFGMICDMLGILPASQQARADRREARAQQTQVQIVAARYQPGQAPTNYAPHYAPHITYPALPSPAPLALPEAHALPAPAVPTFGALLDQGLIGPGRPFLLGYADGQAMPGGWRNLYSAAVAGKSGSGKTTTIRFLAAQSALAGARFLILDPHADAGDESLAGTLAPLAGAFVAPPASDPRQMLYLLEQAQACMQGRLHGAPAPYPLIVAVDEFTALMARSDLAGPLATLIEAIAQEGRKVGVFAFVSGQIFTAARSGGSALRDALASKYVHRMSRQQARLLINAEDAARAEGLPPGVALLEQTTGDICEVTIPLTTAADMVRVGRLLTGPRVISVDAAPEPPPTPGEPPEPAEPPELPPVITALRALNANERTAHGYPLPLQEQIAYTLWLGGVGKTKTLELMYRVKRGGNKPWDDASTLWDGWLVTWQAGRIPTEGA